MNRDADIERELQFHIDQQIDDYVRRGMSRGEARRRASVEFGGLQQIKEECRDVFVIRWWQDLVRDTRLALRGLRRSPTFSVVAVVTLALGIGANTAIFSLIDGVLLRSLPVREPQRLVVLAAPRGQDQQGAGLIDFNWSYPFWDQIRQRPELFDGLAAWSTAQFNLVAGGESQFVNGLWANGAFFRTLGVTAALGRTFSEADDVRGGGPNGPVAVISHDFWLRRFGADPTVPGRALVLDSVAFTIIGVTPPGFFGAEVGRTFDVIVPFGIEPLIYGRDTRLDQRNREWIQIIGRLKAGATLPAALTALRGVQPQLRDATAPLNWTREQVDRYHLTSPFELMSAANGVSGLRRRYERVLMTLMVVVVIVLLIACANIANLMLARATSRSHEVSTQVALGVSRSRLMRQFLTEGAVLAFAGAALGLLFARWGSRLIVRELAAQSPAMFLALPIDGRVLMFTIAVAATTALLFGVAPALRAWNVAPIDALRADGRSTSASGGSRLTAALLIAQVALSLILVVTAGLFIRTFVSLASHDVGFEPNRVLVVDVSAQRTAVEAPQRVPMFMRAREAVRAMPGVEEAAVSLMSPVRGEGLGNLIQSVSGGIALPDSLPNDRRNAAINLVSPGWFKTLGIPLLVGRDFTDADRTGAPFVAVVNQAFAAKFLHGASPLGHTIRLAFTGPKPIDVEVVGVARDAVYSSLRDPLPATMYFPLAQHEDFPILASVRLNVRSKAGPPALLTRAVAAAIGSVNAQLVLTFHPLSEQIDASLTQERVVAMLSGFFGGLALLLAALGLYGVTSYGVTRRRTEIGVRMALGASTGSVVRLVLARVALLVAAGIVIGAVVSAWASTFVAALLYDMQPRDPLTFVGAAAVLLLVAALAGWLPARRAARLDPAVTLRYE